MIPPPFSNIVVRMPNWLGDCVMATPLLADLRNLFPQAHITAFCQGGVGAIIKHDPHIDEVFSFQRSKSWFKKSEQIEKLKKESYDLGILTTNSFSSALEFWRGSVATRLGYATHGRTILLNFPIYLPENLESQHLVQTYKMLLKPLGEVSSQSSPKLYISEAEKKEVKELLLHHDIISTDKVLGINPGAAYGSAKCWLPSRFKELTERLIKENPSLKIIYFGDPQGTPLVNDICLPFQKQVLNLSGKTSLRELMSLIERCDLFLTNDSGPMHIAAALKRPLIALFGSTNDTTTGPYEHGTVIHKRVACSPCYRRECPIDFRCMKQITVDEVLKAINLNLGLNL